MAYRVMISAARGKGTGVHIIPDSRAISHNYDGAALPLLMGRRDSVDYSFSENEFNHRAPMVSEIGAVACMNGTRRTNRSRPPPPLSLSQVLMQTT